MELLADEPAMDLCDPDWPIWTTPEQLPPARLIYDDTHRGYVANSMVSGGVVIRGAVITNSVIGGNARVERDTLLGTRASCCPARASVPTVLCSARSSTPTR
jgi:ADP-glucose pyrophosphorylase